MYILIKYIFLSELYLCTMNTKPIFEIITHLLIYINFIFKERPTLKEIYFVRILSRNVSIKLDKNHRKILELICLLIRYLIGYVIQKKNYEFELNYECIIIVLCKTTLNTLYLAVYANYIRTIICHYIRAFVDKTNSICMYITGNIFIAVVLLVLSMNDRMPAILYMNWAVRLYYSGQQIQLVSQRLYIKSVSNI
jgi:hypothetical protein